MNVGKAAAQDADDVPGLVHRERRLRDVGERLPFRDLQTLRILDRLDEHDRLRRLAHRPLDLLVAGVADENDPVAVGRVALGLRVHLRHERAGGVDRAEGAGGRVRVDGRGDAVRGEDDSLALGHILLGVDEDRSALLELAHDVDVVHDLLPHVDGGAVQLERALDRLDGPLDAGAVAARRGEENPLDHAAMVTADQATQPRSYHAVAS